MIIPRNVKQCTIESLLEDAVKYCEMDNATEIHNISNLGAGDYRIMYYVGELPNRTMKAIIRKLPQT